MSIEVEKDKGLTRIKADRSTELGQSVVRTSRGKGKGEMRGFFAALRMTIVCVVRVAKGRGQVASFAVYYVL
jgi:hypothetical protein